MTPPEETAALERAPLAECPFCGGAAEIWRAHPENPKRKAWIACLSRCAVMTKEYETTAEAIAAWNTRTSDLALARRAEAAEKVLRNIFDYFGDRVDAPGHCHDKPGIWDADNAPGIAGTACEWCAQWTAARALLTPIVEGR